jgi:phosphoribosylglycinamide formyltransferase-1
MQGVIDAVANGSLNARVAVVVSDREDSGCLQRARESGINAVYVSAYSSSEGAGGNDIPKSSNNDSKYKISKKTKMSRTEYDEKVSSVLAANGCDLVLLAGYMRIVSPAFISRWRYRALNVHPSLLPAFSGLMDLAVRDED